MERCDDVTFWGTTLLHFVSFSAAPCTMIGERENTAENSRTASLMDGASYVGANQAQVAVIMTCHQEGAVAPSREASSMDISFGPSTTFGFVQVKTPTSSSAVRLLMDLSGHTFLPACLPMV